MANFVTEDDKRIRDLQQQGTPLITDFLAIDRPGWFSAMRLSLQQLAELLSSNLGYPKAYAGLVNPDNALGNNGDLFFTIPTDGSVVKLFQKIAGVWSVVFNLPLAVNPTADLTYDQADLVEESYGGMWYLPVNLLGKSPISIQLVQGSVTTYVDLSLIATDTGVTRVSGFANNDPQTITIKTI